MMENTARVAESALAALAGTHMPPSVNIVPTAHAVSVPINNLNAVATAVASAVPPPKSLKAKPKKRKRSLSARQRKDQDDDRIIRDAMREFFKSSKGRPEENIRRVKDSILTVLAFNEEVDSRVLARYLNVRSTDMERRLGNAKSRVERNRNFPKKNWVWSERSAVRKDSYSITRCAEAAAFWKSPQVSKLIVNKLAKNGEPRYQQLISLKEAHSAYIIHKRVEDSSFTCSVTWFTKQRPEEVKRMYIKPVGNRRKSETVVATPHIVHTHAIMR
jgi:hypothetical protein